MTAVGIKGWHRPPLWIAAQRVGDHPETGHTVDDGVMHLDIEGESVVFEAVDQIRHPHRSGPVEALCIQLSDQPPERFMVPRHRAALAMLAHVNGVPITPDPDAAGVYTTMRISAKPGIYRFVSGERLTIEFVDVVGAGVRGR